MMLHSFLFLFIGPLYTNLEKGGGTMDGTVGKTFWGVKAKLINVDPETKEGEVAFYTRNTFMGYLKVKAKISSRTVACNCLLYFPL